MLPLPHFHYKYPITSFHFSTSKHILTSRIPPSPNFNFTQPKYFHIFSMSQNVESSTSSSSDESIEEEVDSTGEGVVSILFQFVENELRIPQRRRFIKRNHKDGHARLMNDYFSENLVYLDHIFRNRFHMRKNLLIHIVNTLENKSSFFQQHVDAIGQRSLSPLQKCTAALRQLAYGVPADFLDEYLWMGESTAIECLDHFCAIVVQLFGDRYLRRPDHNDIQRLLHMHQTKHGFPGMLGSLDCMHWEWRNCPVAWKGQFTRGHGTPTIILEAVASHDLWIWHAFFGVAGSRNDINVLNESPLFNNVLTGSAPEVNFMVNGTQYTKGYYLTDGIYPEWSTFVKSFPCPQDPKRNLFKRKQESARKDVE